MNAPTIEIGRRIYFPGNYCNQGGAGVIVAVYGNPGRAPEHIAGLAGTVVRAGDAYFDAILFDGRRMPHMHEHVFSGLRPWLLLDKVHGPELIAKAHEIAAAKEANDALATVTAEAKHEMTEAARQITTAPLFYWNGIKDAKGAKLQKAWYSKGERWNTVTREYTNDGRITIYARDYSRFSALVRECFIVRNDTDTQTDYFDSDSISVLPVHPLYAQVKAAFDAQEEHRTKVRSARVRR